MNASAAVVFLTVLVSYLEFLNGAAVQFQYEDDKRDDTIHSIVKRETPAKITRMVNKIANTILVQLRGDGPERTGYCGAATSTKNERHEMTCPRTGFKLVYWGDVECSMDLGGSGGVGQSGDQLVHLLPPSQSIFSSFKDAIDVTLLPIDTFNSASFTFLPFATDNQGRFFITSVLTGCHFFLAQAGNANCRTIAIHANYNCGSSSPRNLPRDYTEEHAMAVINSVNRLDRNCNDYAIKMRFAPETSTSRHTYQVVHYSMDPTRVTGNLFFGYVLKRGQPWNFCIKPLSDRIRHGLSCHVLA